MNNKSISLYSFGSLSSIGWTKSSYNMEKELENDCYLINKQVRENLLKFEKIKKEKSNKSEKKIKLLKKEILKLKLQNSILKANKIKAFKRVFKKETKQDNFELRTLFTRNFFMNLFFIFFFHFFISPCFNF